MIEKQWINTKEGIDRFSGHANLYLKYLKKFVEGADFDALCAAMESKDYDTAFKCAHTLKGISGNLSLDRFYSTLYDFVEMLRGQANIDGATELFVTLRELHAETLQKIEEYIAKQ